MLLMPLMLLAVLMIIFLLSLLLHLQSTPSSCCQTLVVLPTIARAPLRHLLLKNTLLHLYRMCFVLPLRSISVHVSNRTTKSARLCVSILLLLRQGLMLLVLLLLRLLMMILLVWVWVMLRLVLLTLMLRRSATTIHACEHRKVT